MFTFLLLIPCQVMTASESQLFEERMIKVTCGPTLAIFNSLKDNFHEKILATTYNNGAIVTIWGSGNSHTVVLTTRDREQSCVLSVGTEWNFTYD